VTTNKNATNPRGGSETAPDRKFFVALRDLIGLQAVKFSFSPAQVEILLLEFVDYLPNG